MTEDDWLSDPPPATPISIALARLERVIWMKPPPFATEDALETWAATCADACRQADKALDAAQQEQP